MGGGRIDPDSSPVGVSPATSAASSSGPFFEGRWLSSVLAHERFGGSPSLLRLKFWNVFVLAHDNYWAEGMVNYLLSHRTQ